MVVFNPLKREIDIKIVYYGPALCGKTTNIQAVHKFLNPQQRGELVSLATKDDRTLFFDFLPIELGSIQGFKTRFHIYTVPGQVLYTLTRRAVLTGVDGVIFVADSQREKMEENIESLNDLKENLKYYNKTLESIPFAMQYNKRDLDTILPLEEMEEQLNPFMVPSFVASAVNGKGVMETLTICCKMVLKQIKEKSRVKKEDEIKAESRGKDKKEIDKAITELPELKLLESQPAGQDVEEAQKTVQEEPMEEEPVIKPVVKLEEVTVADLMEEEGAGLREEEAKEDAEQRVIEDGASPEAEEVPHTKSVDDILKQLDGEEIDQHREQPLQELVETGQEVELEDSTNSQIDVGEEESSGLASDSLPEEVPVTAAEEAKDDKRTCPRCSLLFKQNVKKCPVCQVSLVPEGEKEEVEAEEFKIKLEDTATPADAATEETATASEVKLENKQEGKGLEIVACGQSKKISPTTIKVPLIMKIEDSEQEFKVSLAISFEDFFLKSE